MFKIIVIGSKMSTRYNNKFGVCCVFCFPLAQWYTISHLDKYNMLSTFLCSVRQKYTSKRRLKHVQWVQRVSCKSW